MFGQTNTRRTRRTAQEIRNDLANQLKQKDTQIALEKAEKDPLLAPVLERLNETKRSLQQAKLGLSGTDAQLFSNRRRKHSLWIARIDTAEAYARALEKVGQDAIDEYQKILEMGASKIAEGADRTEIENEVNEALDSITVETDEIRDLREAAEKAEKEHKEFSASLVSNGEQAGNEDQD